MSICTAIRPSSRIFKIDLYRDKAKLGPFSLALLPCTSVFIQIFIHYQESTVSLIDENNWLSLTEEEQEEYVNVANSVSNIAAVNELRRLVNTDGATVHRSRAQRLAIQQNPQPYS